MLFKTFEFRNARFQKNFFNEKRSRATFEALLGRYARIQLILSNYHLPPLNLTRVERYIPMLLLLDLYRTILNGVGIDIRLVDRTNFIRAFVR